MPMHNAKIKIACKLGRMCAVWKSRRWKASQMMYTAVKSSSAVSTNAEKLSTLP